MRVTRILIALVLTVISFLVLRAAGFFAWLYGVFGYGPFDVAFGAVPMPVTLLITIGVPLALFACFFSILGKLDMKKIGQVKNE